jgi:peptidoglycan biosynthesis protein MviN/MurJ (putative lipid II flippase)
LLNKIAIAGIVCNVGLNLFLIPAYGAFGTTIATLITQVLVAGIHILACNRKFQTNWEWNLLIRLGLFTGAGFGFVFLLSRVVDTIFVSLPLSAVVLLGLIFIFRLIPMDMILRFVRQPKSN